MKLFLREARRLDNEELSIRTTFTRAAVWGEGKDVERMLKKLDD